jgi:MFS family permease
MSLPRTMAAALLINGGLGVLYIWSLFLAPFEAELAADRGTLSLVPAFALVSFTVGMVLHARLLALTSPATLAAISLGLAGAGHVAFGLFPSFTTLLIGYGIVFGLGGGLGYLLALALATRSPERLRSIMIGLTVGMFAASGIVLSFIIPGLIDAYGGGSTFLFIGIALWIVGILAFILLRPLSLAADAAAPRTAAHDSPVIAPLFFKLALAFFAVCAVGLMVVSHSTGILVANGDAASAWLGPVVYNFGYIVGCLLGGKLAELIGGRAGLAVINVVMLAALAPLALAAPTVVALLAIAAIGATLGGVASLMPMVVADRYGVSRVGDIYGKLNVAYGLGGLIAPWIAGVLFVSAGSYAPSLWLGVAVAVIGILASLSVGPRPVPAQGRVK